MGKLDTPIGPVPDTWTIQELKSLCSKIGSGATPRGGNTVYLLERDACALVRSQNVFDRYFDGTELAFISGKHAEELRNVELQENDLLLNITGDGITFSRACMVPSEILPARVNQHVCIIRPRPDECDSGYLLSYLTHPLAKPYIESFNSGGSRRAITKGSIESFEIPLPPTIEEQRAISHILGTLDDKIELNRRMNRTLEAMAQAIFKSWFVDFEPVKAKAAAKAAGATPEGIERAAMAAIAGKTEAELAQLPESQQQSLAQTAALFPDSFEDSELGEIPTTWSVGPLKSVCRVINGRAYKNSEFRKEGTPIVRIQNLSDRGKTVFSDLDLPPDKMIESGDLVYAWSATFGPHIWRGPKSIFHYHIWKMDIDAAKMNKGVLYAMLLRETEAMKASATGSIFTHLTKQMMENLKLVVPPPNLVSALGTYFDTLLDQVSQNIEQSRTLAELRDTLLPKLLSGELTVPEAQSQTEEALA